MIDLLTQEDIDKIAEAVYNRLSNELGELIQELKNEIYSTQSNVSSIVRDEGNSVRSEVRHSTGGLSGQLYTIQSRVDGLRR
jgi:hypothetical protein